MSINNCDAIASFDRNNAIRFNVGMTVQRKEAQTLPQ
jgi:hypothetical protein